jgi:hypothetical protein
MEIIYKNSDLIFNLDLIDKNDYRISVNDLKDAEIKMFTKQTKPENYIVISKTDILDNKIRVDNSELQRLEEGILYVDIHLEFYSNEFEDKKADFQRIIEMNYYIHE